MTRLYEREIKDFFEVAKIKMAGTSKEAKGKFGKNGVISYFEIAHICSEHKHLVSVILASYLGVIMKMKSIK